MIILTRTRQRGSRLEYYNILWRYERCAAPTSCTTLRRTAEVVFVVSCVCGCVGGEEEELRDDGGGCCATTRNRTYRGNHRDQPAGWCCCRSASPRPKIPLSLQRRWPRTGGVCVPRSYLVRIFFIFVWVFSYYSRKTPKYIMWNVLPKMISIRISVGE